jgi:hypothetical protein
MGVRRKATIIGILAIMLTAAATETSPAYTRIVSSVRSFQHNFGDLKKAESMNSIERFAFSLVLSRSKTPAVAAN